jgi:hypothetical protein
VVYVNLEQSDHDIERLGQYIGHIKQLCHATKIRNWTDCSYFEVLSEGALKRLKNSDKLLRELTGQAEKIKETKRGIEFCRQN